jgi:hypothetical protein
MGTNDILTIKRITLVKNSLYIPFKTFNNYICRQKIYRIIFSNIDNDELQTQSIIYDLDDKNISINKIK